MIRQVTEEEVKQALQSIDDNKAPGCDGYNAFFYKKAWDIIGKKVTQAVLEFFDNPKMCKQINCTTITLVPKEILPEVIDSCQTVFVPGRVITDNIIMSHELIKGYGRKNTSPRCMLKIDMQKAYDSVEWVYVEQVMRQLGIPGKYIT
ncbi:PREDICTED: uncharacterized protein LOC109217376 [Nicotiana attenuata]|uniref:uncharacterized protein LOC109217376 n=1 Tax=Nicotiana attenuata TaxID=49451 RepID=UPI000904EED2|nr:PREDICTED: uncharacterized protein LOC109217376 [Nicotiana attenuata]